jgi:hypothetical protein
LIPPRAEAIDRPGDEYCPALLANLGKQFCFVAVGYIGTNDELICDSE